MTTKTAGEQLDEIMRDLDQTTQAWAMAGHGYGTPEADAREAVFARLREWNATYGAAVGPGRPDLSDFLLARIAEDEAVARSGADQTYPGFGSWQLHNQLRTGVFHQPGPVIATRARVLAECEAKRRIVEQYADYLSTVRAYRSPRWSDAMNEQDKQNARQAEARHRVAEEVAQLLALPYADHPDYREEWRP